MSVWLDPVFDRTQEDVSIAKEKIQEWIKANLTGNPIETYGLKGCFNLADINRIEGNIQYLSDRLDKLHYLSGTSCKVWERSGLPTKQDIRRILSNVNLIISAYYQQDDAPAVPDSMGNYTDINDIEENLLKIKELLDCMQSSFQKSAMLKSGGMRMIPIRR